MAVSVQRLLPSARQVITVLDAGDPAPDFDLPRPTTTGSETYRLSAAAQEGPVVLAFYPVSDVEGAGELLQALAAVDWRSFTDSLAILAVGVGSRTDHDKLADEVAVPFPLLLDQSAFFADQYGVVERAEGGTMGVRPALFVVGQDCFVQYGWAAGAAEANEPATLPLDEIQSVVASN